MNENYFTMKSRHGRELQKQQEADAVALAKLMADRGYVCGSYDPAWREKPTQYSVFIDEDIVKFHINGYKAASYHPYKMWFEVVTKSVFHAVAVMKFIEVCDEYFGKEIP